MTLQMATNIELIAFCIFTEAAREICFKQAANGQTLRATVAQPLIPVGIVLWIVELVVWIQVLERVPLGLAFPLTALVYVVIVFGGAIFFKEKITIRHAIGALCITAGVAWIGVTGL